MKRGYVKTANYEQLKTALERLKRRASPERNIILVCGVPGLGKTGAIDKVAAEESALYLRASAVETPVSLMRALAATNPQIPAKGSARAIQDNIVRFILLQGISMMIIDECQHLIDHGDMLEALRDISDRTECPLVLVAGREGVERSLARNAQIASRIADVVTFMPMGLNDVTLVVRQLGDYAYDDALLKTLHQRTGGKMRLILESINRLDELAKANGLQKICLSDVKDALNTLMCEEWQGTGARR